MHDLDQGVAILLGRLDVPKIGINPLEAFGSDFVPPQSYRYLRAEEVESLIELFRRQE